MAKEPRNYLASVTLVLVVLLLFSALGVGFLYAGVYDR